MASRVSPGLMPALSAGPSGNTSKNIQRSFAVCPNAFQSRVDGMLGEEPRLKTVVKAGVAGLQLFQLLTHGILEFLYGLGEQIGRRTSRSCAHAFEIDSGDIDVVLADAPPNRLYDCRCGFGLSAVMELSSLVMEYCGRSGTPSNVNAAQ